MLVKRSKIHFLTTVKTCKNKVGTDGISSLVPSAYESVSHGQFNGMLLPIEPGRAGRPQQLSIAPKSLSKALDLHPESCSHTNVEIVDFKQLFDSCTMSDSTAHRMSAKNHKIHWIFLLFEYCTAPPFGVQHLISQCLVGKPFSKSPSNVRNAKMFYEVDNWTDFGSLMIVAKCSKRSKFAKKTWQQRVLQHISEAVHPPHQIGTRHRCKENSNVWIKIENIAIGSISK